LFKFKSTLRKAALCCAGLSFIHLFKFMY